MSCGEVSINGKWMPITATEPADGLEVSTRIDDGRSVRNETRLRRSGRLWFLPDGSMYVYYTPTHYWLSYASSDEPGKGEKKT